MKRHRIWLLLCSLLFIVACTNDNETSTDKGADFVADGHGRQTLRIVSGSENKELEPILKDFAKEYKYNLEMDYLGSLDIMRLLQAVETDYDAVWPASSIWLNLGDQAHQLKHAATISVSPIAFGIRESLAKELGFVGRDDVSIQEIMTAIDAGKLKFAMTSASQSNSGASAYLGFLTALAGKQEQGLAAEDLQNADLQDKVTRLLSGVNRSSGSSNWLVDLFIDSNYDAMVNYEALLIQTNQKLIEAGKEPLYLVYPKDGLAISDSPLAYIDQGDDKKEEAFLELQNYLLTDEVQSRIEATGKRSAFGQVRQENRSIFKSEWGIQLDQVLSPINYPQAPVILEALNLYQTQFKKPALTIYVLDYSGSMYGEGRNQMVEALNKVLIPEHAAENLLQGTSKDQTYIVAFNDDVVAEEHGQGNGEELRSLYQKAERIKANGSTAMYTALGRALEIIQRDYQDTIQDYSPAIIVHSDGRANDDDSHLMEQYQALNMDIPIFSIMFGDAYENELQSLANLSKARIFDGRKDLIEAFQSVKGYN
ncbi:VWA domain-containing protein [Ignavigranum ruoffiae]|uniref:VWA domain-containing protein n=1 Tax=Ignavigranum ruoffiae TaxID=89093 RepID=UPI0024ADF7DD|nr:VWA domain-containing protein [Ignavigranum ruoffiae]